jgi:TolB protein
VDRSCGGRGRYGAAVALTALSLLIAACSTSGIRVGRQRGPSSAPKTGAGSGQAPTLLGPNRQGARGDVPWALVGPGWILATWHPSAPDTARSVDTLFLVDPLGGRYDLGPVPSGAALSGALLADWSGDGRRALFSLADAAAQVVDLRTASSSNFSLDLPPGPVSFTKPHGLGVLEQGGPIQGAHIPLRRLSLIGSIDERYPTTFDPGGAASGLFAESPDGTQIVFGADAGLELVNNAGTPLRLLSWPAHYAGGGYPLRWWSGDQVLVSTETALWLVPVSGGAATPLVPDSKGPVLYSGAWVMGGTVYTQAAVTTSAAGDAVAWLDRVNRDGTTERITDSSHSVRVVGTDHRRLVVTSTPSCAAPCGLGPANSLQWFDPATGATTTLLGGARDGGSVDQAILFPATPSSSRH